MKNQFQSLNTILFVLFIVIGMNAFTRPTVLDPIDYDIMEGKIAAASEDSKMREYKKAQDSYSQMKLQYESIAQQISDKGEDVQKLSLLSQTLYVYETEITTTRFGALTSQQQIAFLTRLNAIKIEFYSTLQKTK